jgi:hypothetical protein
MLSCIILLHLSFFSVPTKTWIEISYSIFRYCYKKPRQHSTLINTVLYKCIQHTALLSPFQHTLKQLQGEGAEYSSGRVTELKWLRKEQDVVALHTEYRHFFPLSYSLWTALP